MVLSLSVIVKRNLVKNDEEDIENQVLKLTHVRLDRENISEIENLECLGPISNLYLQHNCIQEIKNLESVASSLTFLSLANNEIRKVAGLLCLEKLILLDLSCNLLDDLNCESLPKSLVFVSFKENQCCLKENYREDLIANLPNLKSVDGGTLFSDSDSESESEEEDGKKADVKTTFTEVLERCCSRMNEVAVEHKQRKAEIEKKTETTVSQNYDDRTSVFEKRIQHVLNEMISAERDATTDDFQLPSYITVPDSLESNTEPIEYIPPTTPILTPTKPSSASRKTQQSRHKQNLQNSKLKTTSKRVKSPKYCSMGTTTSKTPKTLIGKSNISVKVLRTKKHPVIPDINTTVKLKSDYSTSDSLIRIPGARPFRKT